VNYRRTKRKKVSITVQKRITRNILLIAAATFCLYKVAT
jgi:hypothetical protein